jgi:hypothetical protein
MHMKSDSAPSLRPEDRPDFERALTEALRSAYGGPHHEPPLSAEQLRTMALSAIEPIVACAAPEYQQYVEDREQVTPDRSRVLSMSLAEQPSSGAGLFAVVAVLTPILAGTAALIFLVLGYLLHAVHTPEPTIAAPLRTAGWLFAAIAAIGILAGMIGLVSTALRNGSTATRDADRDILAVLPPEVAAARDTWLDALTERGIKPFLYEALAQAAAPRTPTDDHDGPDGGSDSKGDAGYETPDRYDSHRPYGRYEGPSARDMSGGYDTYGAHDTYTGYDSASNHSADASRMPRLGYSRPEFSSPAADGDPADPGPHFSSPRFTGPHFGGPGNEAR